MKRRVEHTVELSDGQILVGYDGEGKLGLLSFVNIADPTMVAIQAIGAKTNNLAVATCKLVLQPAHLS